MSITASLNLLVFFQISAHILHSYILQSCGGPSRCHTGKRTAPRDKNENLVQIDFVSLDQTSESLIPDGSLSACLKHGTIGERFPGNNPVKFQVHNKT